MMSPMCYWRGRGEGEGGGRGEGERGGRGGREKSSSRSEFSLIIYIRDGDRSKLRILARG